AMSVGASHTCAIHGAGRSLSCWGRDDRGQLGDGTPTVGRGGGPTNTLVALPHGVCSVAASELHTCAALTDGSVSCWGSDDGNRLGGGGDTATPRVLTSLP
ncbi:MAG: RTX toxin, partial [Myxococcales bacterium]|nr:RTX toxin [Myxococcales bacterium]